MSNCYTAHTPLSGSPTHIGSSERARIDALLFNGSNGIMLGLKPQPACPGRNELLYAMLCINLDGRFVETSTYKRPPLSVSPTPWNLTPSPSIISRSPACTKSLPIQLLCSPYLIQKITVVFSFSSSRLPPGHSLVLNTQQGERHISHPTPLTMSNSGTHSPINIQTASTMATGDNPDIISQPTDTTGVSNNDQKPGSENDATEYEETIRSSLRMLKDLEARIARIASRYDVKLLPQDNELSGSEWARRLTWAVEEIADEFTHLCEINYYRFLEMEDQEEKALWDEQWEVDRWEIDELQGLVDAFYGLKHEFLPRRRE
ncbi:uncharacterized protein NECHADRAFT_89163 [Fusarium vanettenii 77-13-4]|uniref:Uncharacterized protein n=1 Tax=Fusarium vanettenii (strain ATCC MYA-4622 / CBS 123669 / FGSC 9596 / NRRL 45880 / 77-13-4) TaxID=660122 RepID=C7ZQE7_FUSV7|nr:uncharacterized protein NECHADRAFT_89163 [Fusarium vanettenii 77-13-4]EEU33755.1 predicted protein [Fusarium vanettenii 77-13-4]